MTERRIILAADGLNLSDCLQLVRALEGRLHAVKVHNLYDATGPDLVHMLKKAGAARVWVDMKLKDIPETVKNRAAAYDAAGADMLTVHASGGIPMMVAARNAFRGEIYGITVLTSLDDKQAVEIYGRTAATTVKDLATLALKAALDGVVCSPKEVAMLSGDPVLKALKLVIPGTRSPGTEANDQARVDTPANAVLAGATYLVIGRQITQARDPVAALEQIEREIHEAMAGRIAGGPSS